MTYSSYMRKVLHGKYSVNNKYILKCILNKMKTDFRKFYNMFKKAKNFC